MANKQNVNRFEYGYVKAAQAKDRRYHRRLLLELGYVVIVDDKRRRTRVVSDRSENKGRKIWLSTDVQQVIRRDKLARQIVQLHRQNRSVEDHGCKAEKGSMASAGLLRTY